MGLNMEEGLIARKSMAFAVRIVKVARYLKKEKREYELVSQLLRSGTSIGANISESKYAESDRDFVSKLKIALKEANETKYWLRVLLLTETLSDKEAGSLTNDADEIIVILTSIINTKKANMKK